MLSTLPKLVETSAKNDVVHQRLLEATVREIFPNEDILILYLILVQSNARREANIVNQKTGHYFEVDIWLPGIQLGFEFQDDYHYMTTWYSHISLDVIKRKDIHKKEAVNETGTTLIGVPNWWNVSRESLAATIKFERPEFSDICHPESFPIPLNPPFKHFNVFVIPDIGELMYASYPNSTIYASEENPWWMGEKYDGIRSCWNFDRKKLYSRLGNEQHMEASFLDKLPPIYLDQEVWFGRGQFPDSQKLVRGFNVDWPNLRLVAFDEPSPTNQNFPFELRYTILANYIDSNHPFVILAPRLWLVNQKMLNNSLENIINDGGEGIILRKPNSVYENGRSELLWKLKATRGDMEALVMRVEDDKSLNLQLPSGITFTVPGQRTVQAKKGDIVTFSYDNFSNYSLPVNPVVIRVRLDTTWENIVKDFKTQNSIPQTLSEHSLVKDAKKKQPMNFWNTENNSENAKSYLVNFAKSKNLDPLHPNTWYSISGELLQQQPAKYIFRKYSSYIEALQSIFPNIGLQTTKFNTLPPRYWLDVKLQREYFAQFAKNSNFDPLVANNWYNVSTLKFLLYKSTRSILTHYEGSYSKALLNIFPEIGLDKDKIPKVPNKFWYSKLYHRKLTNLTSENDISSLSSEVESDSYSSDFQISQDAIPYLEYGMVVQNREKYSKLENQREFFISYANKKRMDPLIPDNWYPTLQSDILAEKDGKLVLSYNDGSLYKTLFHVFPDIGLAKSKFREAARKLSSDQAIQHDYFCEFAKEMNFDPNDVRGWYLHAYSIYKRKGARTVLMKFANSVIKALQYAFPDLSWDPKQFKKPEKKYDSPTKQREFFESYAKFKGFDALVPSHWYSIPIKEVYRRAGAKAVLAQFQGSTARALLKLFPEIGLNPLLFKNRVPSKYWNVAENRRAFFEQYARQCNLDPLNPEDWYKVKIDDIMKSQKGISVMYLYKNRLPKALLHLFPEIGLEKNRIQKGMASQLQLWLDKKK